MKNLFEQSRSHWVRYDRYELKAAADGKRYITPGKNAKPDIYNPLKEAPGIVLDALNVGMLMMNRSPEDEVQKVLLFLAGLDMRSIAKSVMEEVFRQLAMRYECSLDGLLPPEQ